MQKNFLIWGSIIAALGVILGAFGAHALKTKLTPDQLQVFDTGVRYQMYHAIALLILFPISGQINSSLINYSGYLFVAGIILFSGSVYLLACKEMLGVDGWKGFLGPITPLGGLCFIAGWICLLSAAIKYSIK